VFGDRIQVTPGLLAIQAGGIAALVVGVIMVARAPALSQLRSCTETSISRTPLHGLPGIRSDRSGDSGDSGDKETDGSADQPLADAGEPSSAPSPNGHQSLAQPSAGEAASHSRPDIRGLTHPRRKVEDVG
jgi:hypothetical protein